MALNTNTYGYLIDPFFSFCDQGGTTIANGYVRVFLAGTSTPVLTYRNYDGASNAETIELDNSGRTMTHVIASKGSLYKVCVYDAEHSQEDPIITVDKVAVIGSSVNATNIVQGMNDVAGSGWINSVVADDTANVSLDATNVTSEVDTMVKAIAASADYMIPLVHKTGSDPDKKITLGNIFKFVLDNIVNLATTITSFASGDYFVVGRSAGAVKMSKDSLLTSTAQNALAGNVAQAFDPTKPNDAGGYAYYTNEHVIYNGKIYRFESNHSSGAWNASQVTNINIEEFLGREKTIEFINFVSTGSELTRFISTIPGELVKLEIDSTNWTTSTFPSSGRIFFIDSDSLQTPNIYLGSTIPSEFVFRAGSGATYLHVRGDSGSQMSVKVSHYGFVDSHRFDGTSQGRDLFEMGNITVHPNAIGYSNSTSRLRSKQGIYFDAKAGDYIEVTSKTYSIGIGYKYAGESTWTWSNWLKRFEFAKDGEFVLLARLATESTETFDTLIKSFLVYTQHGSCSDNARIINSQTKIEAVDSSILTKIKSVSFVADGSSKTINLGQIDDECWLHYDTQENIDVSSVADNYAFFVIRLSDGVNGYADAVRVNKPTGATTYSRIKDSVYIPKGYGNLQLYMRASSLTKPYLIWIDKVPPIQVHYPSFGSVKSVAHRGSQGRIMARENTTAAMRLAAIYGYKFVETDLHTTSDGHVVCFHDDAIPNLGNIADLTLAQVKTYQPAGFLLDPTIPTLEELLQVCKEYNLHPYLEIKGGGNTTASAAIAIVADYGMLDNVTWLCFTASYLQTIKTAYAKSRLGLLGSSIDSSLVASAQALKNDYNEVFVDVSDASNYALAKAENIPVEVWTVTDLPAQHYVSGLTTNNAFPITGKYKGF